MSFHRRFRVKSEIWVQAYLRRCASAGAPGFVVRRGDADAGAILIKVSRLDGRACVFAQTQDDAGEAAWRRALGEETDEAAADRYIEGQLKFDPDL